MDEDFSTASRHEPVLLAEAVAALAPKESGTYVDATFGGGGYARALLARPIGRLFAIDRDPAAIARARALAAVDPRLVPIEGRFGDIVALLGARGVARVDGIVADLGLSSDQLEDPERGFSFRADGPLDMRMDRSGPTAAELLARLDEKALAEIFARYGDEPDARRIARAVVRARERAPLTRTSQLRELVVAVKGGRTKRIDPATRVFQALRIAVNDEFGELERLLAGAVELLVPGGRLVIVSFHSGEDRIVKHWVETDGGRLRPRSRHAPPPPQTFAPRLVWLARGVVRPSPDELARNPRARSARLRAAVRTDAPAEGETEENVRLRRAA
ncbi:MAG: 16S rRNA (cytosine(1402)-N(4))-methyltransferase RsmH [Geminicoccaceae bacterium]|nr:16S rRNA (cytosine(1402)-N(4))-methyltransferase RsmH [Geminicoccaceae bacterium]MCS7268566.1 16S rRNA (cytosine(1402)-N(4))-methyltransferase RsmH [Geminicoccaceae bacterium]MCX7629027.1 16S rRNA (cytosine(1402)-N(4))-methyltransferase RsmH [Geminicoccaceae bacterium]MDW8123850.1 16S rRNA (cytosine(1402)-N(4))-methyltransferase RsmH [Geminicoccaceae bacterium]MDW8341172.1 16S rRNA (cytosine(1402)-N(4))-methyltransferase RsmH [Geminicoccaceae bacterium]